MSNTEDDASEPEAASREAVIVDYLPHGRPDDTRPQYQKAALAYALETESFDLLELTLTADAAVNIVDRIPIDEAANDAVIEDVADIEYDDLSTSGVSELEYAIEAIIDADEQRFVAFYNDAQPISLRLHQLNLLPGIGKKLRNKIIDKRKRQPFESFADLADRVGGLHNPKEVIAERIMDELRDEDLKYKIFVRNDES
mgnify:CR=1 FL=1